MIRLVLMLVLTACAFAQEGGLSLAQQRVQNAILGRQQDTGTLQSVNTQTAFSQRSTNPQDQTIGVQQGFDFPQQPLDTQQSFVSDLPSNTASRQSFSAARQPFNNQRPLTVPQQSFNAQRVNQVQQSIGNQQTTTFQQRHRLELEARQQQERLRQQRQRFIKEQRFQNQQRVQQQQSILPNRPVTVQTRPQPVRPQVPILDDDRDGPFQDGTYYFRFATGDGIQREEGARRTGPFTHEVTGSYTYVAPDGTLVAMEYIADENGFRAFPVRPGRVNPVSPPEPIPVPPPIVPVVNTQRPALSGTFPSLNRPSTNLNRPVTNLYRPSANLNRPNTNLNRPVTNFNRPPFVTQPLPNFNIPAQNVQRPIQSVQRPFQTVQTGQQPAQTFQTVTPEPFVRPFATPQSQIRPQVTPRPQVTLRPQVTFRPQVTTTRRPQFFNDFNSGLGVQPSSSFNFNRNTLGRSNTFVDYDNGNLDYAVAASDTVVALEPVQSFETPSVSY